MEYLPHQHRIVKIDKDVLKILARTFEDSDDWDGPTLVSIHAEEIVNIINKFGVFNNKTQQYEHKVSECWHETNDVNLGNIKRITKFPKIENYEMICSGPHFFVGNPLYKTPREVCTLNSHYDVLDLTISDNDHVARTNFSPVNVTAGYGSTLKGFELDINNYDNWLDYYKLFMRGRVGSASERTLSSAIFPPKTAHVHSVISIIFKDLQKLVNFQH